jgi:type I restriction enzyme S subunit
MALRKIKLGELLEQSVNKNNELLYSLEDVRGISIKKIFIETKADMEGVSLKPYLIVKPDEFAYVTVTSRNGEKITLAYNNTQTTYIVSSSYVVFRVKRKDLLNSTYLFMYFNRPEFDRYSRYNSWGSAREVFTWQEMCDLEIELPDLETQEKFVKVYQAMCENQKAYERGLDDLKLVCDGYIENLRRYIPSEEIGKYLQLTRNKNTGGQIKNVLGISKDGFINPNQDIGDLNNYFVFNYNEFVYSPPRINIGSIGLYKGEESAVCSPIYITFRILDETKLYPDYLMMWFKRNEFFRLTDFYSLASVRNNFSFESMCEVRIPIPDIKVQKSIADIYKVYIERKEINERLKAQIKDLCPILIKGSLEA